MPDVVCPSCRNLVPLAVANTGRHFWCGGCQTQTVLDVFPAAFRKPAAPGAAAREEDARCFFHDHRPAQAACEQCGRYLCRLCDVPVGNRHLCPECLAANNRAGEALPNERLAWDRMALWVAIVSIFLGPVAAISGPIVLFLCIRYWRKPGSLVGRAWPRFLVAALLSLAQMTVWWGVLIAGFVSNR